MSRSRYTRDGTRRRERDRRFGFEGRRHDDPSAPRSDDDPATENTAAEDAYNDAATAAAASNVTAYMTAVKAAAQAAANARSGANSTGDATDDGDAAEAEEWAVRATKFSTFTCLTAECRTRGGTASLCGHSEFQYASGGVSTPPKKYRTKTAGGTMYDCARTTVDCSGSPAAGARYDYSGACSYSATTCNTTNTLNYKEYNDASLCPAVTLTTDAAQLCTWGDTTDPASASCLMSIAVTKTRVDRAGTSTCCDVGGGTYTIRTGSMYWELTTEDTEADAISRLQTSASWSSWSSANTTSCLAKYETRTSGFSFAWQEAQFRATISIPNTVSGTVKVGVYRRAYGSGGAYSLISTEVFSVTGDPSDEDTISMDVPNEQGYETYVACLSAGI